MTLPVGGADSPASDRVVAVQLRSLRAVYAQHGITMADVVKWDVENAEFEVLDDLLKTTGFGIPACMFLVEWHARFGAPPSSELSGPKRRARAQIILAGFVSFDLSASGKEAFINPDNCG